MQPSGSLSFVHLSYPIPNSSMHVCEWLKFRAQKPTVWSAKDVLTSIEMCKWQHFYVQTPMFPQILSSHIFHIILTHLLPADVLLLLTWGLRVICTPLWLTVGIRPDSQATIAVSLPLQLHSPDLVLLKQYECMHPTQFVLDKTRPGSMPRIVFPGALYCPLSWIPCE